MAKLRVKKEGGVKLPGYTQREPPPRQKKTEKKDPKLLEKPIKPETGGHCGNGPCCGEKSCGGCEKPHFVAIRL